MRAKVVFGDGLSEVIDGLIESWEKGNWSEEGNRLVLKGKEGIKVDVIGCQEVPEDALEILKKYRETGENVAVVEGNGSLLSALEFLSYATVEVSTADTCESFSLVQGFAVF